MTTTDLAHALSLSLGNGMEFVAVVGIKQAAALAFNAHSRQRDE